MADWRSIGERIAYYRRRRGLTQQVLAELVGRFKSWLTKVERGELVMDRISTLLELGRVLKVEPGALIGGVSLPPNGGAPHDPPRGIIAVRRAILANGPPDLELDPARLRAQVQHAKHLERQGSYEAAVMMLPDLLSAGRAAAAQDAPSGWWCIAAARQIASRVARKVGDAQLAWIAAERAGIAAERSDDDSMVALSERLRANALMRLGWLDEAAALCSDAADMLAPTPSTDREGWSVWGTLQLTEAVATVRGGDAPNAWRLLHGARAAAETVSPGGNESWEGFGSANVGLIEVTVAMESGEPVEALRLADHVEVDELTNPGLRARFSIHVAHAHALRRNDPAVVLLLLEAERHAAEEVRFSVKARELVRVCLGREHKSRTPGLRDLARRLGVTD